MKHVIACREPGGTNPDRWVMIAGEPGNWGEPSRPIYRAGTIEDAINGLIQARFRHDLALTEEPFTDDLGTVPTLVQKKSPEGKRGR